MSFGGRRSFNRPRNPARVGNRPDEGKRLDPPPPWARWPADLDDDPPDHPMEGKPADRPKEPEKAKQPALREKLADKKKKVSSQNQPVEVEVLGEMEMDNDEGGVDTVVFVQAPPAPPPRPERRRKGNLLVSAWRWLNPKPKRG